ncbi:MarR family winged helix-turn-helix transcriptional regulator [Longispora albida]|uniref:MarR family winged helix-turn-helix transcriptional regulator n=1 Tax=Longispora albida TaxID=203523 RepID=UPI0012FCCEE3|nr:MarR family transcriptional regulator [Longispora albida]
MTTASDPMPPATDPPERIRRVPSRLLGLAAAQADRLITAGLAGAKAHRWHYTVLASLGDDGPASQAGLSRRTGIWRSDLVAVLNELEAGGYVLRAPDPADRRRNVITITEPGRGRLTELDTLVTALQDRLMAPFDAREREQLVDLLARLVEGFPAGGCEQ